MNYIIVSYISRITMNINYLTILQTKRHFRKNSHNEMVVGAKYLKG